MRRPKKLQTPEEIAITYKRGGSLEDFEELQWYPDHDADGEREEFGNKIQYMLTIIGFSLGNGAFWKFPQCVFRYGGGLFVLKYLVCMIFFGIPALYLELMIGQIAQVGPARAFGLFVPMLQGVGWLICITSFVQAVNYNILNAYSLYYTLDSFFDMNSLTTCGNEWNSEFCFSPTTNKDECHTEPTNELLNDTLIYFRGNCTPFESISHHLERFTVPSEEFFSHHFDAELSTKKIPPFEFGNWKTAVCVLACWVIACVCLARGIRFLGRLLLLIVTLSFILTLVLFVRNLIEVRQSGIGVAEFFKFTQFRTNSKGGFMIYISWIRAISECRRSLSLGMGGMVCLSSYNKRSNDAFKDACIIAGVISFCTIIFTLAVFVGEGSIINKFPHMTWAETKFPTYTLYFSHYPEVLAQFALSAFWSTSLFFMLFSVGMTTLFGQLEVSISGLTDMFSLCKKHRSLTVAAICALGMLLSLPLCTKMGHVLFRRIDRSLLLIYFNSIMILQVIVVAIYGPRNFYRDINVSLARSVNAFGKWVSPYGVLVRICQFIVLPLTVTIILINTLARYWASSEFFIPNVTIGWQIVLSILAFIHYPFIIIAGIFAVKRAKFMGQGWRGALKPGIEHPSLRYKVPSPVGRIFGLNPIEVVKPELPTLPKSPQTMSITT